MPNCLCRRLPGCADSSEYSYTCVVRDHEATQPGRLHRRPGCADGSEYSYTCVVRDYEATQPGRLHRRPGCADGSEYRIEYRSIGCV